MVVVGRKGRTWIPFIKENGFILQKRESSKLQARVSPSKKKLNFATKRQGFQAHTGMI